MGAFETIPAALTRAAALWPDVEALVDADERITFREYAARADRVSRALVAAGIGPGDRVAVWMPNTWETAVVAMGVYGAGAVVVPVNTRFKAGEMAQVVRRAGARLLFVRGDFLEAGDGVPAAEVEERRAALGPSSLSDVLFTSGTTGAPKGVMLCHGGSVGAYLAYNRSLGLRPGDRMLGIAPFFHCFGLKAGVLSAVLGGATLVPQAVFDVHRTADLIGRERLTVLAAPPPVW